MTVIAVTGAAGTIGSLLTADLAGDFELRKLDRARREGVTRRRQDVRRLPPTVRAFAGADAVIDLAGDPSPNASWQTVTRQNIPATVGVLEAARLAGVRRVVYASSNHVTGLYERDEPYASICAGRYEHLDPRATPMITGESPIRPDGAYAVGKAAGEAAARLYAESFGLSVICVRIGAIYPGNRPGSQRGFATMLTDGDLFRLVRACIAAPDDVRFAILYGVSANTWRFWDIEEGRRLVGYEPLDDAEQWRV